MKKRLTGLCILTLVIASSIFAQTGLRSFDDIFPGISAERRALVFSGGGFIRSAGKNSSLEIMPSYYSGIDIRAELLRSEPSYMAESLLVVPYTGKTLNKLDIYNALGRIQDLKGRTYDSHSRGETALFQDATRIQSPQRTTAISDPPPAVSLPSSETVYIRLRDVNFGNSFYRGDISFSERGVSYRLTNFRSISYLLLTVMREEKFNAFIYIEPLAEGTLVYCVAGADTSDFIANRIDIPSAIAKRLGVFIDWAADGLKRIY